MIFREDKKTERKSSQLLTLFLCCILLTVIFTGCVSEEQTSTSNTIVETIQPEIKLDTPSILPNWKDAEYHNYYTTTKMLKGFNEKYAELVKVFSIGKSVLGKDIWCIRLTNEKNITRKSSCLIDGCMHGNEWEGGEACLYLAEYLLINFNANETITYILNSSEIYIVPFINPDGRQANTRWNENGIDLNRNFEIGFGRLMLTRGAVFRFGKLFGFIKIPYIKLGKYIFENCGRRPFSEPETQAIRDLMRELENNDFSFYVNCHTADHNFYIPWGVFKPPFEMTEKETNLFNYVLNWVEKNTEYGTGPDVGVKNEKIYYYSGMADDWCFKESRIPSYCFEILTPDYFPSKGGIPWDAAYLSGGKHDHLVHWMQTTIPVFMYLLVNIDNLREWQTPDIKPPLPEGVPPEPLK